MLFIKVNTLIYKWQLINILLTKMSYIIILLNNVLPNYIGLRGNKSFDERLKDRKEGRGKADLKKRNTG